VYAPVRSSGRYRQGQAAKEPGELDAGEDTLVGAEQVRPLVALEPVERVGVDVAAPQREREDTAERREDPLDGPGRQTGRLQLAPNGDDIVDGDQHQAASAEARQQMTMQLRAIEIKGPVSPLARHRFRLEVGEPAARDLGVSRGESGSSPLRPALWSSSRCSRASTRVVASTVRKRARPSTLTQTAYLPLGCW
jgi:hypothetical protein